MIEIFKREELSRLSSVKNTVKHTIVFLETTDNGKPLKVQLL